MPLKKVCQVGSQNGHGRPSDMLHKKNKLGSGNLSEVIARNEKAILHANN